MSEALIQSYVFCEDKAFFVSTINRESSAMLNPGVYAETMIWEWDSTTRTKGALVHQREDLKDSIHVHLTTCQELRDGVVYETEEDCA